MISTRNATNTLVVGKNAVPVRKVADDVCDRKPIDYFTRRYPLTTAEIFECIDAVADIDKLAKTKNLILRNVGEGKADLLIEVRQVTDICFLKLVQYGRVYLPNSTDFNQLFDTGLLMMSYDVYKDIIEGNKQNVFADELSECVYNAMSDMTKGAYTEEEIYSIISEQVENEIKIQ